MTRALYLLRKDLRLEDNPIIDFLVRNRLETVVLAVDDPRDPLRTSRARDLRMRRLRELDHQLNGKLHFFTGMTEAIVDRMLSESRCEWLVFQRQLEPWEQQIEAALAALPVRQKRFPGFSLVEPEAGRKADGSIYRVFRAYYEHWLSVVPQVQEMADARTLKVVRIHPGQPLPLARTWPLETDESFFDTGIAGYDRTRDIPARIGTARLSHRLNLGEVSIQSVYRAAWGHDDFIRQLAWRDYYLGWIHDHPECTEKNFRPVTVDWSGNERHLAAWKAGETGYELVDAAMRQLEREGWINGRLRMLAASFLIKDLHVDWRLGEAHFREKLIDADQALNVGNWQYMAGTGALAQQPYRVLSPETHRKRFDPDRAYIRRYVDAPREPIVDHEIMSRWYKQKIRKDG